MKWKTSILEAFLALVKLQIPTLAPHYDAGGACTRHGSGPLHPQPWHAGDTE